MLLYLENKPRPCVYLFTLSILLYVQYLNVIHVGPPDIMIYLNIKSIFYDNKTETEDTLKL